MSARNHAAAAVMAIAMLAPAASFAQANGDGIPARWASVDLVETAWNLIPVFVNPGLVAVPLSFELGAAVAPDLDLVVNPHVMLGHSPRGNPDFTNFSIAPSVGLDWHPFDGPWRGLAFGGWLQGQYAAGTSVDAPSTPNQWWSYGIAAAATASYRYVFPGGLVLGASGRLGVQYTDTIVELGDMAGRPYVDLVAGVTLSVGTSF